MRERGEATKSFVFGKKSLNVEQTVELAKDGLMASVLNKNAFEGLTAGFAGVEAGDLDQRLAWMMSFRTVYNAPPPTLWLGTVVTTALDGKDTHLLCMRPSLRQRKARQSGFVLFPTVGEISKAKRTAGSKGGR